MPAAPPAAATGPTTIGLRRWLFGLTLAALVPVLLFAGYLVAEVHRTSRAALLDDLTHRAVALQGATDQMLDVAAASVRALAASRSAQAGDWAALHAEAQRTIATDDFVRAVSLVDDTGAVLFHTARPFGPPLFKANDPASVDMALRTGRVTVSGAFIAPIDPQPVVAVSVPLTRDGQTHHVLRAVVLAESIDRLLTTARLPEGWVAGVTDAKGTLLARSAHSARYVGQPAAPSFFEGIRRGDGRPFQGQTLEGVPTSIVVLPVHDGDWYLGLAVPDAVLSAGLDQSIRRIAAFALVWFGLALGVAHVLGGYLITEAGALAGAAAGRPVLGGVPRVKEFRALLDRMQAARQGEAQATGQMIAAQLQRDEVQDLYEHAPCGYHSLDPQGRLLRMNATELRWLGYHWDEVRGRPVTDLLTPASKARFAENFPVFLRTGRLDGVELDLVRKDGSTFPVSVSASAVKGADGQLTSTRSTVFDITQRKALEARLDRLARTDTLTGLPNRRDFFDEARRELQRRQRAAGPTAVLMLDVDHFKRINDTHGHAAGDAVLAALAGRLAATLRAVDRLARIGGEEFAVLLPDTTPDRAAEVAERLRVAVAAVPVSTPEVGDVPVTVSVGVAACEADDTDVEAALHLADDALYQAKAQGRNRVAMAGPARHPA
jgi:diguanylate cyclase (GGDEF)-like protein/PAS domain S-box-containing protein